MGETQDPVEQFARELAREAGKLPARWQLWLFEWLRDDLLAADAAKDAQEQELSKMAGAVRALEQVAEHLGLKAREEQLTLTMGKFDEATDEAREGLRKAGGTRTAKTPASRGFPQPIPPAKPG